MKISNWLKDFFIKDQKVDLFRAALTLMIPIVLIVAFLGFQTFSQRYQEDDASENLETQTEDDFNPRNSLQNEDDDEFWEDDLIDDEEASEDEDDEGPDLTEEQLNEDDDYDEEVVEEFLEIMPEDCNENCQAFKDDETDFEYCQQICGLTDRQEDLEDNACDELDGLEKDYCLKDLAIENQDLSICEKITDKNVVKTCANRIWEDILENSPEIPES